MPDDKERNWLDRIGDEITELLEDLTPGKGDSEGLLEKIYDPIFDWVKGYFEPSEAGILGRIERIKEDPNRLLTEGGGWLLDAPITEDVGWLTGQFKEYVAEPSGAWLARPILHPEQSLLGLFTDPRTPWETAQMAIPPMPRGAEVEEYRERVPWLAREAMELPAWAAMDLPIRGVQAAAKLKPPARLPVRPTTPTKAVTAAPTQVAPRPMGLPTTPTKAVTTPPVRVRAGLEGAVTEGATTPPGVTARTAGMPPVKPPRVPPRIPPEVPPVAEGEALFRDLGSIDEVIATTTNPNFQRKIANLPIARRFFGHFAPSMTAKTPAELYKAARAQLTFQTAIQEEPRIMGRLRVIGVSEELFGKVGTEGTIASGTFKGKTVDHIIENLPRYKNQLTPEQAEWIRARNLIEDEKLAFLKRNNIEIRELSFEEGGHYAGRRHYAKFTEDGELLELGYMGGRRPTAKIPEERPRFFKDELDAINAGFRPLASEEALSLNVIGAYNKVTNKKLEEWFLRQVPFRTTGASEELVLTAKALKWKRVKAKELDITLSRAVRGERVPPNTIDSIGTAFPDEAARLKALIPRIQAGETTAAEVQNLSARAKNLYQRFKQEATKAEYARARSRERALVKGAEEAGVPQAFPGKYLITTRAARDGVARKAYGRSWKELNPAEQVELLQANPNMVIERSAQELRDMTKTMLDLFDPSYSTKLTAINQFNMVQRVMALAGDASPFQIQLILFPYTHPVTTGQAVKGFVKSLMDKDWMWKYQMRPENQAIYKETVNLINPTRGGTDITQAFGKRGWLTTGPFPQPGGGVVGGVKTVIDVPFQLAGRGLRPFGRAYESAQLVAGTELRKGYAPLCTSRTETAAVEDFINAARGMGSGQRLGVSPLLRQWEGAILLAPMYMRGIIALIFMPLKMGIGGKLALRFMIQGLLGLHGSAFAYSLARGESLDDAMAHITPGHSRYMTWDIAGQNVGPGSKFRSILKLIGDLSEDPERLTEIGDNPQDLVNYFLDHPAFRFARANLAGAPSTSLDILTGKDYIGDPTRDGMLSLTERVSENLFPIWMQSVAFEGGNVWQRMIRGTAEFVGWRAYPMPATQERTELRNSLAQETHGVDWYSPEMLQKDRNALYASSTKLQELDKQILADKMKRGDPAEVIDDYLRAYAKEWKYDEREKISADLLSGKIDKGQWNWRWYGISKTASGIYMAQELITDPDDLARYEKWREEHTHPWDKAVNEYYEIEDTEARERYLGTLSDQVRRYVTYMIEEDWKLYLGPNAQKAQQLQGAGGSLPRASGGTSDGGGLPRAR